MLAAALVLPGTLSAAQKVNAAITNVSDAAAAPGSDATSRLSVNDIVQRLADGEKKRALDLKGYTEERHYSVSYKGFPANLTATIVVEATYAAPGNKQFRIVSQTGSKMLADHVLKKLLEAEEEAAAHPSQTAPTTANYNFTLVAQQIVDGRPCYVLQVEPRTNSKLLYRGTIWVDADDFAVAKIEAQPARNPSFWIRDTKIHHVNAKTGEFWLPERNQSETDVRMGGRATLTIDYGSYKMAPDSQAQQAALQPPVSAPSGK
ncbi:MAG TPA: outer membrane lipoprotein-sorting protein [Acidobacteriaceae bacterium]|jgi:hypothetical protein|nr:outer membrane lipoprotein-sorting protein [Acidobacteriaceae bacterium]